MFARLSHPDIARVLITTDAVGGVWNYTLELAAGLLDHGLEVTLAVLGPPPDLARLSAARRLPELRLIVTGLPLDWTAASEHEAYEASLALTRLAEEQAPDILQLHTPALAADMRFSMPCIAVAHSCVATWWRALHDAPLPTDLAWRAQRMGRGMAAADVVVAVSRSFAAALAQIYGQRTPIVVVPNGKRPRYYPRIRRRHCVFTAGRLWDAAKNAAALDRAASRIDAPLFAAGPSTGPNGETPRFAHLQLLGELGETDMSRWYGTSGIFVSAARYEPFGLSVLEAAQAGAALVLSDIPSFRELWDGAALFTDTDDFAPALQSLLDKPDKAAELGGRAQQRSARYGRLGMVRSTLAVYRSALRPALQQPA